MNYFSKNKLVFWSLIFLVILNLSVLATYLLSFYSRPGTPANVQPEQPQMAFRQALSLSPEQESKVSVILKNYHQETGPLLSGIRDYRIELLEELEQDNPDTGVLNRCTNGISLLQEQIQKASVRQYLEIKALCSPSQYQKLSSLYFELYGFQNQGKGKGMMHRYRKGPMKNGQ
ncbi:MAG TPA: periplasmic heavy metal sensor [Bacteroidales bacterium]|nr:periplasmic heavy metal sensor [Bacteroidales bacterium]